MMIITQVPLLRFLIIASCITAICLPLVAAQAQTASTSTSEFPETLKVPTDIKPASSTGGMPANIFSNRIQARITNLSANMSTRMENMIMRFEQIIDRMEKRIAIMKTSGSDTTKAEAELVIAKKSLNDAKAALTGIDAKVRDTVSASDLKAAWPALRSTYTTTRTHLLATHVSLVTTVNLLKSAVSVSVQSSSTTQVAPPLPVTQ